MRRIRDSGLTARLRMTWLVHQCYVTNDGDMNMFDLSGRVVLVSGAASGMGRATAMVLASEASSWITGALIPTDGGNLAMNAGGSVGTEVFGE